MQNALFTLLVVLVSLSAAQGEHPEPGTYLVRRYGAMGDGRSLDTRAIQSAIDSCAVSGGEVVFTPGIYLTGSLELRSNVTIRLMKGATILGSANLADYREHIPQAKSYNDVFLRHSLFYAERQWNISIIGEGVIDGQGGRFQVVSNEKPLKYLNRPYVIRFVECRGVRIEGVTLQNSAMWMQQYFGCEDLRIHGVTVFNHANKNNDMMDIDGCRNVIVSDCIGDTDDDGITIKSTSERIAENISINNCVISSHCNAIKTGTESNGGFRNIVISNIVVKPSRIERTQSGKSRGISGIALTLVDGGIMEGVSISNIVMDGPEVPLFIRLGNRARKFWDGAPRPGVGRIRNIAISNVSATNVGKAGCSITGIPGHPVEGITIRDVKLVFAGGGAQRDPLSLDEMEDQYPEATMWKDLPAYAFFVRHASQVTLRNVEVSCEKEDARPAVVMNDVRDATMTGFIGSVGSLADAAIVLEQTKNLSVRESIFKGKANSLIRFLGNGNADITVIGNDLSDFENLFAPDVRAASRTFEASNRMMAK